MQTSTRRQAPPEGMFDLERSRPGLMAVLYAAAIVGALLASHFWPWGVAT